MYRPPGIRTTNQIREKMILLLKYNFQSCVFKQTFFNRTIRTDYTNFVCSQNFEIILGQKMLTKFYCSATETVVKLI